MADVAFNSARNKAPLDGISMDRRGGVEMKWFPVLTTTVCIGFLTAPAVSCQPTGSVTGRHDESLQGSVIDVVDLARLVDVLEELEDLGLSADSPLEDKLEDAAGKVRTALEEFDKHPSDLQAALGNLEGAVGDLEAATEDRLLSPAEGVFLMEPLAEVARNVATEAVGEAFLFGGEEEKVEEAAQLLIQGDSLLAAGRFKEAVAKYKSAVAEAEGA